MYATCFAWMGIVTGLGMGPDETLKSHSLSHRLCCLYFKALRVMQTCALLFVTCEVQTAM